jgi:hypothetical protein
LTVGLLGLAHAFGQRAIHRDPGVLVAHDPVQAAIDAAPFAFREYQIKPQATYDIEARVLSTESYRFDGGSSLAPIDFAVGWGPMSDSSVLDHFRVTQGARFFTIYPDEDAIDLSEALRSAANMHLIPADKSIADRLSRVRVGSLVHLQGFLVNVTREDGFYWNSSLTREDTGNGACELFFVRSLTQRWLPLSSRQLNSTPLSASFGNNSPSSFVSEPEFAAAGVFAHARIFPTFTCSGTGAIDLAFSVSGSVLSWKQPTVGV